MTLLCCLVIIIFLHELGHLLAAKFFKCGVTKFSVGFGKPIFSKKIGSTIYQITPFLLGGFCELKDELKYTRSKYSFTNKTYAQKVIISLAGVVMNVLSAFISYGIYRLTHNFLFYIFAFYSLTIGLSNLLPIPALDGSFWITFLFEPKKNRKQFYAKVNSLFSKWFFWLMVLNVVSIPYLIYYIATGVIR